MNSYRPLRHTKRLHHSRLFITVFLFLLQILLLLALATLFARADFWIDLTLRLLSLAAVFWILSRADNASYKLSWTIAILISPLIGGLFYLIFGNKRFGFNMKKQLEAYAAAGQQSFSAPEADANFLTPAQQRLADYLQHCASAPLHSNSSVEYFPNGETLFQRMLKELKQAERFIFLEYFIISEGALWNSVLEILEQKAKAGVEIRLLYDDAGCILTLPEDFPLLMQEKGIRAVCFNPLHPRMNTFLNYRDHRKICVIDGNTAFTGGANLSDEYVNLVERHGHWKDTGLMLKGSAVENLSSLFLQMWQFSTGEQTDWTKYRSNETFPADGCVQPFGDDPMNRCHPGKNAYLQLCANASRFLYITSPYLILDDETVNALQMAALSGVDVRIITPHIADKWYVHAVTRSFYRPLLESGVQIFEYTPGFIHAKMLVCDDSCAIVGTTNLDFRSFYLQFECGAVLYHSCAVGAVKSDFLETEALSQKITLEQVKQTALPTRILQGILRFLAPLM